MTWQDVLTAIREGKTSIPAADNGIPLVAINAPFYELMQLMEALTTGYNDLVARATKDQQRIERIRKLAMAHFPADRKVASDGWVSVADRLPPESGCYMTYDADNPVMGVYAYSYSARHELFNAIDAATPEQAAKCAIHVTHWHPSPLPPVAAKKERGEE